VSKRKGRSRLEEIREWRETQGFDEIRSLYFKIHDKAKTATDYQHNVCSHMRTLRVQEASMLLLYHSIAKSVAADRKLTQ
uniref:hypothetical protein n=1 Tax=Pseudomonas viridiflava TaxID=33069 RepID=UPI00197D5C0F